MRGVCCYIEALPACSVVETLMELSRAREAGERVAAATAAAMLELLRPCHGAPAEVRACPERVRPLPGNPAAHLEARGTLKAGH